MAESERGMPCDLDAERAVLGSILRSPDRMDDVVLVLQPASFYDPAHRQLYEAYLSLWERQRPMDLRTVSDVLQRTGALAAVGGPEGVVKIFDATPTGAHALYYAEIVRDRALRREVIDASHDNLSDAYYAQGRTATEVVEGAERRIYAIAEQAVTRAAEPQGAHAFLRDAMATIEARLEGRTFDGYGTGLSDLDTILGGLRPGAMTVIGARPGEGKTALATQIGLHVARTDPVLYFSLEMSSQELAERMLSTTSGVPLYRLRGGMLTTSQRQAIVRTSGDIASGNQIWVEDNPQMTVQRIAAVCRRQRRRHGLGLVILDYLQLLQPDNNRDQRQEQVAKMSRRLKLLARELESPVLVVCQLNRQAADEAPRLHHLRESGAIEQDADIVLLIHRGKQVELEEYAGQAMPPAAAQPWHATLSVAKNRQGATGPVQLLWRAETTQFVQPDHHHRDDGPPGTHGPDPEPPVDEDPQEHLF